MPDEQKIVDKDEQKIVDNGKPVTHQAPTIGLNTAAIGVGATARRAAKPQTRNEGATDAKR
jgi:hypothetical protein